MQKLSDLFDMKIGHNIDLNSCEKDDDGVNFIARSEKNNGKTSKIKKINNLDPGDAGSLTVVLVGSVLSCFVQHDIFYTSQNVMILTPKKEMDLKEKMYWKTCVEANKFKYSYGRNAHKTIKDLLVPDKVPDWVYEIRIKDYNGLSEAKIINKDIKLDTGEWKDFKIGDIFEIKYGNSLELSKQTIDDSGINFISRTSNNNGVSAKINKINNIQTNKEGAITVALGGSVLSTFVQGKEFYNGYHIASLYSLKEISIGCKLFLKTMIEKNKFKYSYGRQANKTLKDIIIKLPVDINNEVNWKWIDDYIKSLKYSKKISND